MYIHTLTTLSSKLICIRTIYTYTCKHPYKICKPVTYMGALLHMPPYAHTCKHTCTHVHTYAFTYVHTYICTSTHARMYIHPYAQAHMHIFTSNSTFVTVPVRASPPSRSTSHSWALQRSRRALCSWPPAPRWRGDEYGNVHRKHGCVRACTLWYVCVYVCVYACVCVRICPSEHVHVYAYVCVQACI